MRVQELALFVLLALVAVLSAGCPQQPRLTVQRPLVVSTLPDLADWAENVGGGRVAVRSLLTGSEEPHSYEPKPQDAELLARADVLIRVGLGLDDWVDRVATNARSPRLVTIVVGEEIDLIQGITYKGHTDHSHPQGNPHVWLDPVVAEAAIGLIVGALCRVDPGAEKVYLDRAERYVARLDSAVQVLTDLTSRLRKRRFVSMHESWPYFSRRFGLQAVAAIEPLPGQETSARQLAALTAMMKAESISVVVVEPQHNRELAEMLARETGATVVVLASVTGALPGVTSYISLLDYNVRTLVGALER